MNDKKCCWNCLHEYQCDWTPAGERSCCKDWVKEYQEGSDEDGKR